jgi:translocation and assembly module TamB
MRWLGAGVAIVLALILALGLAVRYGVLTEAGRNLIVAPLEGLQIGPLGRLHVEGLTGDVLRDFRVRRLAIIDAQGVWLDARDVAVRWKSVELLQRRVHIESLSAANVEILRRPILQGGAGQGGSTKLLVSVKLDRLQLRLATDPGFSVERGLFDIGARLVLERGGAFGGAVSAQSRLRQGDGLDARFDFGLHKRIRLDLEAGEGKGGALAGAAGLPAKQPFSLAAHAEGAVSDGHVKLRAQSGATSIAQADGVWTQGGGAIDAWLSLTASSLTDRYAREFGPQLKLTARGAPGGPGLEQVNARISTDNAVIQITGLIDPKKSAAPHGLEVQAQIKAPNRLIAAPLMGAFAADGVATPLSKGWIWKGRASVEKVSALDYTLARVAGPVEVSQSSGEFDLKADLQGTAGKGAGLLAAAAGTNPHAVLEAARLGDGRLLIRSLKAKGDGLDLNAQGQRTLFGALNFSGDLKVDKLAAARAGAHGGLDARWSASQGHADQPWRFTVDATGDKFASGYAELDRLLGAKPKLSASATYDHGVIAVTKADLNGAAAQLGATGVMGKDGALKFALKWSADGPFTIGPLEVTGKARGGGDLAGVWSAPRADLTADFEQIALPNLVLKPAHVTLSFVKGAADTSGQIAITAGGEGGASHAKADFKLLADGVTLENIDAAAGGLTAAGSASLRGADTSSADLTLAATTGALLSAGRADARLKITGGASGGQGDLTISAVGATPKGADITFSSLQVKASGPLGKMAYTAAADGVGEGLPFHLTGAGVADADGPERSLTFEGSGKVRQAAFRTLAPATLTTEGPNAHLALSLSYGGGRADVDVRQAGREVNGKAVLDGVDLSALGEDVAGRASGQLSLEGEGSRLEGALDAQLTGVRTRDAPAKLAVDGAIKARLADSRITLDASAGQSGSSDKASVSLALPAEATAAPFRVAINRTEPIQGRFDANGELQPIWDLFFGGDRTLGGHLVAQGSVSGSLNTPRYAGHATLTGGRFEDAATGLKLRNLVADVDLADTVLNVSKFSASDAKAGVVSGSGRVDLATNGASSLTLNAKGFQLLDNDAAKAVASGAVTVTRGADGKAQLKGALTIDRADISAVSARAPPGVVSMDVVEINRSGGPQAAQTTALAQAPAVELDIQLTAPGHIFVKGFGLNAEMSLAAHVSGTTAAPVLSGTAHVVRGDYDLAGKRFEIDDQGVVYLASDLDKIRLDLSARLDDPTITAIIQIQGTAAKPKVTLTSTPALPSDEVLSEVLFGRSAAQLSPVEAAQLAAAVTSLATGGGFDVMGGLRSFAKLDRLALGGGDTPSALNPIGSRYLETGVTVSGGKYIGNRVYLELTGGGRLGPSAQVEVKATRAFSVISQLGGEEGAKLAVRWRVDYGKAKMAKVK